MRPTYQIGEQHSVIWQARRLTARQLFPVLSSQYNQMVLIGLVSIGNVQVRMIEVVELATPQTSCYSVKR